MNSKTTGIWFVVAAALAAFIFIFQHYLRPVATGPSAVLPNLRAAAVTSVQVFPANALEIRADRTNGDWLLTSPVLYPAQSAAVGSLLDALQHLTPARTISAGEIREYNQSDAEFGLENPPISLVIEAGGQRWQLHVGNRTAPGDQVYLRVVGGAEGAFVADAGWLKLIPRSADEWRDTALVDSDQNGFNWLVLTNGAKVIELRRNPTNQLWRMTRPLQARADAGHIADALRRLQAAHVAQFLTGTPKADPAASGLQPADLDLWLGSGTNLATAVHIGKSPTNDPAQVFAMREGWNTVFTTAKDPVSPWYGTVNSFRDTNLLELTAPVAEIEMRGTNNLDNNFDLLRQGSNNWTIAGEKFSADAYNVQLFIKALAGLRVVEFVKEAVTAPDLTNCGLAQPQRQITLRSRAGDTNAVIAQLSFGAAQNGEVFVRRADEDFIYAITAEDFNRLPEAGWEFHDRRIWNFIADDVTQITIHQGGKTRQIVHGGPGKWTLAPGSQGIIAAGKDIEQTVEGFGALAAAGWVGRNITQPENYGFGTNNLQVAFDLKDGRKFSVDFGAPISNQTALAGVALDGERWAFIFPPVLYQFVLSYLAIPANVP